MTTVFHNVDDEPPRRTTKRPTSSREPSLIHSTMVNGGASRVNDASNISRFRDTSMPRRCRRNSEPAGFRVPRSHPESPASHDSPPQMIAIDEWRDAEDFNEHVPKVDEPHISEGPHPLFSGEGNADRPRARQLNNFGSASLRPGRDERRNELSPEDRHFSDTTINKGPANACDICS